MKTMRSALPALAILLTLTACAEPQPAVDAEPAAEAADEAQAAAPQSVWESGGLKVTALRDAASFPGASLSLAGVPPASSLPSGPMALDFTVEGYELGAQTADAGELGLANSGQGQHIHLIVNNGPYSAHYVDDFDKELEDGYYVLLAFLSRSYHMSLKDPAAAVVTDVMIGDPGPHTMADLSAPHLFYSRPKGTYEGADAERLMLDFYLVNTELSADGNKVRATINGNEFVFTEWLPYVIEGLPMGEVEIRLELIDGDGSPVPGPFNDVTRTVTLASADAE